MEKTFNRRDYLKLSGGALAVVALGSVSVAVDAPATKKRDLHKAIMYGTIKFPGSVLEKFRALKAAGFEGVEPMSHMNQDEVVEAFQATGLKAASVCCSTHWDKPLSDPSEKVRGEGLAGLLQALRDAKRYGASSVLLVPGVVNHKDTHVPYEDVHKRSIEGIRKAIPLAQELGVKIAVENVWNDFITKPEEAKAYLDEIDSPWVGWHFDIGNCIKYSPPETWIPVLGKKILKLHIKEYSKSKGEFDERKGFGVQLFEGDNHWPAIMKALDDVGYTGWGISEQPGDQSKDYDALKVLSERMSRAFAS